MRRRVVDHACGYGESVCFGDGDSRSTSGLLIGHQNVLQYKVCVVPGFSGCPYRLALDISNGDVIECELIDPRRPDARSRPTGIIDTDATQCDAVDLVILAGFVQHSNRIVSSVQCGLNNAYVGDVNVANRSILCLGLRVNLDGGSHRGAEAAVGYIDILEHGVVRCFDGQRQGVISGLDVTVGDVVVAPAVKMETIFAVVTAAGPLQASNRYIVAVLEDSHEVPSCSFDCIVGDTQSGDVDESEMFAGMVGGNPQDSADDRDVVVPLFLVGVHDGGASVTTGAVTSDQGASRQIESGV